MNLDKYLYHANTSFLDFEFDSEGPKGKIRKIARFIEIDTGLFNFGFGDLEKDTRIVNDLIISNNGDATKILATVVNIIDAFTTKFSDAVIFIRGATESRTRWYQMNISKYLNYLETDFEVFGYIEEKWEYFQKGKNYKAFFARRKKY